MIALLVATLTLHSVQAQQSCSSPLQPEHGSYNITPPSALPYSAGTKAFYWCNHGYRLQSRQGEYYAYFNPIECQKDGTWNFPGPTCAVVNCRKPMISKGSGVTVVGTNYTFGAEIRYECEPGYATSEPVAWCMADGSWSNKYNPWCIARRCSQIVPWYANSSLVPYGYVNLTQKGISDRMDPDEENCHYKAEVNYTCTNDTHPLNSVTTVMCDGNGTWSPVPPVCYVQGHQCTVSHSTGETSCPDEYSSPLATACCTRGENDMVGERCCLPKTRDIFNMRFSGLTGQCAADMVERFSVCSTQITDCLDKQPNYCIYQITPNYNYGCNAQSGAPPPRVSTLDDQGLQTFCTTYVGPESVVCVEEEQSILDASKTIANSICLPKSCASNEESLTTLANSTLFLKCALAIRAENQGYCKQKALTIKCRNGLSGTAEQTLNSSCSQCPQPGGDQSLTSCCQLENDTYGCCLPEVAAMFEDRLRGVANNECRTAVKDSWQLCGSALAQCLSTYVPNKMAWNQCPSFWGCPTDVIERSACPTYWPGTNNSVWCSSWCDGGDHGGPWTCQNKYFCLNGACQNITDLSQLAESNAHLECDYWKLTSGQSFCGKFISHLQCTVNGQTVTASYYMKDTSGGLSTSVIVAIAVSIATFLTLLILTIFLVKRRRRSHVLYQKFSDKLSFDKEMIEIKSKRILM